MKTIEKTFYKKGILYETERRSDKCALFKLFYVDSLGKDHVGWEVCKIYTHDAFTLAGRQIEAGENVASDEMFGYDGSKAFFPQDKSRAIQYFIAFDRELHTEKPVIYEN
jgi:hypothetical protein